MILFAVRGDIPMPRKPFLVHVEEHRQEHGQYNQRDFAADVLRAAPSLKDPTATPSQPGSFLLQFSEKENRFKVGITFTGTFARVSVPKKFEEEGIKLFAGEFAELFCMKPAYVYRDPERSEVSALYTLDGNHLKWGQYFKENPQMEIIKRYGQIGDN